MATTSATPLNIGQIVVVSTTSTLLAVLQILLVCVSGYVVARLGYLDKKAQKMLNVLNLNLFTPALIFSKIALSLDASKLGSLALVPAAFIVFTATSTLGAWALGSVLRLSAPRRKFVMGCAMAVNLPIALIQSLSVSVSALKMNATDTPDAMLARGISYLIIYSTLGLVWRYSFMVGFLAKANEPDPSDKIRQETERNEKALKLESADRSYENLRDKPLPDINQQPTEQSPAPPRKPLRQRILAGVWEITSPALVAAVVSLIIAAIKPVQTVISKATPLTGAINLLGAVSIPLTLVVLGAYFVKTKPTKGSQAAADDPIQKDPTETRTVIAAVISRMILSPVLLFPLLGAFVLGTTVVIFDDPVFVLAMSLLISGPTAVTMAQLTSKSGAGPAFERMISSVIFWSYLVVLTPMTIITALISIIISTTPDTGDIMKASGSAPK